VPELDALLLDDPSGQLRPQVRFVRELPDCPGEPAQWPSWLPQELIEGFRAAGIAQPWRHQLLAAELIFAGRHSAISTPTASGKSLAYQMPILAATAAGVLGSPPTGTRERLGIARHTALYIAPTKALAHDQRKAAAKVGPAGWQTATLDGDSSQAERRFARDQASFIFTNPDMLHCSVLPSHAKWVSFLSSLRYVVVDEAHRYRGVFGAHVAAVLRRLRRICARYGADPTFVLASATAAGADITGARLIGEAEPLALVDESNAPQAAKRIVLWQPADSAAHDAADLMSELVHAGHQTLAFVPSRNQAELVALRSQRRLDQLIQASGDPGRGLSAQIAGYRAGYLAQDRRDLERALNSRKLGGAASTNALELGVDIAGLDAVLIAGFPGTLSAFWQQAGRAGRAGQESLVVLLAKDDPLDGYLFNHPELIFDAPVEATVLNPHNPHILGPHLAAAAQESPLISDDERWFGPTMTDLADQLSAAGLLRRRSGGWFWTRPERAVDGIDLRGGLGRSLDVIEAHSGRVIGQVDRSAADRTVHEGAIYLHQGEQWLVREYWPDDGHALVEPVPANARGYFTQPKSVSDIRILGVSGRAELTGLLEDGRPVMLPDQPLADSPSAAPESTGSLSPASKSTDSLSAASQSTDILGAATRNCQICHGDVELSSQVIGYLRRDEQTLEVWDHTPLDLPVRTHQTHAFWLTVPSSICQRTGLNDIQLASAAHAAEHTAIGLLPIFAPCDRWDIGGLSTLLHPDTGQLTIFVHDAAAGGAGFAEHGFRCAQQWWTAALERLRSCPCETGCPACIVSPKCGNANQMLDKSAAEILLSAILGK